MKKRNIISYSPKLDSRGALGPLSMVLVCGSMTKTWVLPISEVFDLFLDKISMAFAACFLIHSSEQKIQPSFGSLSQQKQVFFLTTTWNIKQIHIRYSLIDTNDIIEKGWNTSYTYYPKMNLIYNCISRLKYCLNFLPTHPRYLCCYLISQFWLWRNVNVEHLFWNSYISFQLILNLSLVQEHFWQ